MKEINLPSGNYLFVEVPDDAEDFKIKPFFHFAFELQYVAESKKLKNPKYRHTGLFLKNNFEIISTTKDITEEQAIKLVENHKYPSVITYRDYMFLHGTDDYEKEHLYDYFTAKESLQSLIQANGLDVNKNYLILKKL
jgi:hypothetical protein